MNSKFDETISWIARYKLIKKIHKERLKLIKNSLKINPI